MPHIIVYHKLLLISPGLLQLRKCFLAVKQNVQ